MQLVSPLAADPSPIRNEIKQLTGLRGIAALTVGVGHMNIYDNRWLSFINGNPMVDLFFCLSAFTLCLVYQATVRKLDFRPYFISRFARIAPLYWSALLFTILICWRWKDHGFDQYTKPDFISDLSRQILFINAWPIIGSGVFWDQAAWSVSIEMFGYIVMMPLLFRISTMTNFLPSWIKFLTIAACGLIAATAVDHFYSGLLHDYQYHVPTNSIWHWGEIMRGISMFIAGTMAYLSVVHHDQLSRLCRARADLFPLLFLIYGIASNFLRLPIVYVIILIPFLIIALMNDDAWISHFLSKRICVWLGHISYSFYLLHIPVQVLITHVWAHFGSYRNDLVRIPVILLLSLIAAHCSYYYFEVPARIFLRKRLSAPSPERATLHP